MTLGRFALASLAFLLPAAGSFSAGAADLPRPAPAIVAPVSAYDWSGLYIGAHVGWGEASVSGSFEGDLFGFDATGPIVGFDVDGWLGGAQVGYNAQFNNFVLGVEADIAGSGISGSGVQFDGAALVTASVDVDWMATLRARAGFAFDRFLIYATGGLAVAGADVTVTSTGAFTGTANDSQTHIGWTLGIGAEYAFTSQWSLGVEYKYVDLGSKTYSDPANISGSATVNLTGNIFTARLNYHF